MITKNKLSNDNIKNYSPLASSTKTGSEYDIPRDDGYDSISLNSNIVKYAGNLNKLSDFIEEINVLIYKIESRITNDSVSKEYDEKGPIEPSLDNLYNCNDKLTRMTKDIEKIILRLENLL